MARIYSYSAKHTASTAEYREIRPEDLSEILAELQRWIQRVCRDDWRKDADWQHFRDVWFHRRSTDLPRGRNGVNTPASAIAGILENFLYADPPQRDLTRPQMEIIEEVSAILSQAYDDIEQVRFKACLFG